MDFNGDAYMGDLRKLIGTAPPVAHSAVGRRLLAVGQRGW
jgi:hypothetical protein